MKKKTETTKTETTKTEKKTEKKTEGVRVVVYGGGGERERGRLGERF